MHDAEDAGEVSIALDLLGGVPGVEGGRWAHDLAEMVEAGPAAPSWMWARYACGRAYRWALANDDSRVDEAVRLALVTMHQQEFAVAVARDGCADREALHLLAATVAATDLLVQDAVLFDEGVLGDYLRVRAGEGLRHKAATLGRWARRRPSIYRLGALTADRLLVTDLVTGNLFGVLHTGEALGHDLGAFVLGRLGPIPEQPRWCFVERPLAVDRATADEIVRSLRGGDDYGTRWACLAAAASAGRMLSRPGTRNRSLGLASAAYDLPPEPVVRESRAGRLHEEVSHLDAEPSARVRELMGSGLTRGDAEHVVVCEYALWVASVDDVAHAQMLPILAHHASVALAWEQTYAWVARELSMPDMATRWEAMARCVHGPARDRFFALAATARRAAAA